MKKIKVSKNRMAVTILAGIVLVLFIATIVGLFFYRSMIRRIGEVQEEVYAEYPRLYAFIAEDPDSQLSNRIYKEISEYAKENGCYVEMTGENLSATYSKADRINIAISSKVDGIILEGDDSEETKELIRKAEDAGVPVVTILSDCEGSERKSFIGLNQYTLGTEYGNTLTEISTDKYPMSVLILKNGNSDDFIIQAIQKQLTGRFVAISSKEVDTSSQFTSEENIMKTLDELNKMPDVIICLNDKITESAIQSIVEKNLVGKTRILGYYDSETIRKAIEKGSVYATFTIDTKTLAIQSVNALNEFNNTGHVSDFYTIKALKLTRTNLSVYSSEGDNNNG
ncbi:MAG: substrate-binding domain-containing protein [Saccharofermentans sp.]|jgi:ribose transport system substrate-binding protein|nr:substrate-binding domain-containing protein [Saccharofermentans sp.]